MTRFLGGPDLGVEVWRAAPHLQIPLPFDTWENLFQEDLSAHTFHGPALAGDLLKDALLRRHRVAAATRLPEDHEAARASDYEVVDYEIASVIPAKSMAMTVVDLLSEGASAAKQVLAEHKPALTRQQYLETLRGLEAERTYRES